MPLDPPEQHHIQASSPKAPPPPPPGNGWTNVAGNVLVLAFPILISHTAQVLAALKKQAFPALGMTSPDNVAVTPDSSTLTDHKMLPNEPRLLVLASRVRFGDALAQYLCVHPSSLLQHQPAS